MSRPVRDPNRPPTHPGAVLRLDVLPELGLTQEAFAERLGVSRLTVSQVLNEHRGVSPSLAVKLQAVLRVRAEQWLAMQIARDLWDERFRAKAAAQTAAVVTSVIARAKESARAYTGNTRSLHAAGIQQAGTAWTNER